MLLQLIPFSFPPYLQALVSLQSRTPWPQVMSVLPAELPKPSSQTNTVAVKPGCFWSVPSREMQQDLTRKSQVTPTFQTFGRKKHLLAVVYFGSSMKIAEISLIFSKTFHCFYFVAVLQNITTKFSVLFNCR